jgi:hypothetical protein
MQGKADSWNTKRMQAQSDRAETKLRRLAAQKPTPEIRAKIDDLQRKVAKAKAYLRSVKDKSVRLTVTTFFYKVGKEPGSYGNGKGVYKAKGGPVMKGQPYVVGDGGRPELFVPDSNGTIMPKVPDPGSARSAWSGGGNGGGDTYNIYVTEPLGTPEATGAHIVRAMTAYKAHGRSVPRGTFGTA